MNNSVVLLATLRKEIELLKDKLHVANNQLQRLKGEIFELQGGVKKDTQAYPFVAE